MLTPEPCKAHLANAPAEAGARLEVTLFTYASHYAAISQTDDSCSEQLRS